jgi:glutamate/tyrosine decarboxylase-like PLP-dependent enzyme
LYTPYEAGCVLVRDPHDLYEAFHILPAYLEDVAPGAGQVNLCDYGIQLSRGTRALKIWMAIRAFGLARYRAAIGRMLDLAPYFETRLKPLPGFQVTSPASLGVVTFRYVPPDAEGDETAIEAANREIVRRVWDSGRAMLTSTRVRGRHVLRVCIINHGTRRADVDELIDLLAAAADA